MAMRVLFTTPAGIGHINPTVPLAQAMAARGHAVLWAVPPDGVRRVEQAGIRAAAVGRAGLMKPGDVLRRHPEFASLSPVEAPDLMFGKLFGEIAAPALLDDLLSVAHEWRPDLVVADAAEFAGHIVAAELGVPSATKAFGALLPETRVARAGDEVASLWRSRGLEPRPYGGSYDFLYLDIYPPELQGSVPDYVGRCQLLRPVIYDGNVASPSALSLPTANPNDPLVYVTMGTVFNDPARLQGIVAGIATLDVRVLATVGPHGDPSTLGSFGSIVRVERYVPQTLVLPECDVVVSHAGSGTVVAALTHGLPQLCLPQGADQFINADAVVGAGAGLSLKPDEASLQAIGAAVGRLLLDKVFGEQAHRVSRSIVAMPSPDDVAAVLEAMG